MTILLLNGCYRLISRGLYLMHWRRRDVGKQWWRVDCSSSDWLLLRYTHRGAACGEIIHGLIFIGWVRECRSRGSLASKHLRVQVWWQCLLLHLLVFRVLICKEWLRSAVGCWDIIFTAIVCSFDLLHVLVQSLQFEIVFEDYPIFPGRLILQVAFDLQSNQSLDHFALSDLLAVNQLCKLRVETSHIRVALLHECWPEHLRQLFSQLC